MALTNTIGAYPDCHEFFEAIVEDPQGGRIWKGTEKAAEKFRHRCHQFRRLHRRQNERIYPAGDKMHGQSEYDTLVLRLKEDTNGEWWVYAEHALNAPRSIELLSEVEPNQEILEGDYEVVNRIELLSIEDHSGNDHNGN